VQAKLMASPTDPYPEVTGQLLSAYTNQKTREARLTDLLYHKICIKLQSKVFLISFSSVFRVLVAENADLDVRLSDFSSALHLGVQSDVVVQLVQGKAATEVKDRQGRTALHLAAHSGGKSSLIDLLLSANSNVNVSDNEKKTALHLAAMDGDKHVVASLLSHKAKVLVRDMDGSTPLHYAAAGGHASIVSILLRSVNNRGLEDRNAWRKTSLHVAAEKGHDGVVVVLLETGAKVNATDQSKDTPLHCAARGGHPSVVERLLNWGQTGPKGQQNMNPEVERHSQISTKRALKKKRRQCDGQELAGQTWAVQSVNFIAILRCSRIFSVRV
uniref:CARD- and ANK-containing Inflammasome Adaptor Protein n=1 Tax=Gouania willdenowi TaxID=441366 RepID=A0A8C5DE24_GOUWI